MKRLLNVFGASARPLAGLFLVAILFTACKKDSAGTSQHTPTAGLMAFNLAPDQSYAGFSLSGANFGNSALSYNGYTGGYFAVSTGSHDVRSFDANSGNTLAIANGDFADSMFYSVFLIGANSHYRNVLVNDGLNALTPVAGKAYVRYINAIVDSTSTVPQVSAGGDSPLAAPYGTVSFFAEVNAGSLVASINNGSNITATRTLTLEQNKAYTLLFVGIPGSVDPDKMPQVKVVENGTVTP